MKKGRNENFPRIVKIGQNQPYCLLSTLIIGLFLFRLIKSNTGLTITVFILLFKFEHIKNFNDKIIHELILENIPTHPHKIQDHRLMLLLLILYTGVITIDKYWDLPVNAVTCYLSSYIISVVIFSLFSLIRQLALLNGIVSKDKARRGLFALLQRIFIIFRHIVIFPIWFSFFNQTQLLSSSTNKENINSTMGKSINIFKVKYPLTHVAKYYLICNSMFMIYLFIGTIDTAIRFYRNGKPVFISCSSNHDICVIYQDSAHNSVSLKCGHAFCKTCVTRWLINHNTCPMRRKSIDDVQIIEYIDGSIPIIAYIFSF